MSEEKSLQYSTFFVNLPSGGKLYKEDSPLREGVIEMKFGTTKEEDILLNKSYINKGIVFDKLLESLIVTKGIDLNDLVLGDYSTLVIETKKSMYGAISKMKIKCPSCGEIIPFDFNIDKLEVFTIPENIEKNSFEYKSSFGNIFQYHILTHGEHEDLKKAIKKLNKLRGSNSLDISPSDGLVQIINSLNGDNNKSKINDFIKNGKMSSIESSELREEVLKNTPDVDLSCIVECKNCSFEDYIDIPLDVNFFWNTGDKERRNTRRIV